MRKTHIKKAITFIMCLFTVFSFFFMEKNEVNAKTVKGYTICVSDLDSTLKRYIKSMSLTDNEDGSYTLYINDAYIGDATGNEMSFTYKHNSYFSAVVSINLNSMKCTVNYTKNNEEIYNGVFKFSGDEKGNQYCTFYPYYGEDTDSISAASCINEKGIYDFGTYNYTYADNYTVSYTVKLNTMYLILSAEQSCKRYDVRCGGLSGSLWL